MSACRSEWGQEGELLRRAEHIWVGVWGRGLREQIADDPHPLLLPHILPPMSAPRRRTTSATGRPSLELAGNSTSPGHRNTPSLLPFGSEESRNWKITINLGQAGSLVSGHWEGQEDEALRPNGYWRQGGGVGVLSDRGGGCPTSLAGVKKEAPMSLVHGQSPHRKSTATSASDRGRWQSGGIVLPVLSGAAAERAGERMTLMSTWLQTWRLKKERATATATKKTPRRLISDRGGGRASVNYFLGTRGRVTNEPA